MNALTRWLASALFAIVLLLFSFNSSVAQDAKKYPVNKEKEPLASFVIEKMSTKMRAYLEEIDPAKQYDVAILNKEGLAIHDREEKPITEKMRGDEIRKAIALIRADEKYNDLTPEQKKETDKELYKVRKSETAPTTKLGWEVLRARRVAESLREVERYHFINKPMKGTKGK